MRKEFTLENLVTVNGYNAGKEGNRLVSLVGKEAFDFFKVKGGLFGRKEVKIYEELLITAVILDADEVTEEIGKQCDEDTPDDEILVISGKFCKLPKKQQLALLEKYNAIMDALVLDNNNLNHAVVTGEIIAVAMHGSAARRAIRKEEKVKARIVGKVGKLWGKQEKKEEKQSKKTQKPAQQQPEGKAQEAPKADAQADGALD